MSLGDRDRCSYSFQPLLVMPTVIVVNCSSRPTLALTLNAATSGDALSGRSTIAVAARVAQKSRCAMPLQTLQSRTMYLSGSPTASMIVL